jgi:hypothetical protein
MAADPVITFTVSGASNAAVEFCPWGGSAYVCDGSIVEYPANNTQASIPRSTLAAGAKYAVRVTQSKFWTLWWHQTGFSPVKPTTTASGEYLSAGASSIALGTATLKQIKYLTGAVTSTTGTLLDGIQLGIYANPSTVASGDALTGTDVTGEGTDPGHYNLAIPYDAPGNYVVGLRDPLGRYADAIESVSLSAADTTRDFTLALQDLTVTVGGTVALTGAGDASGVAVEAFVWTDQSTWAPAGGDASAESASDGSYQLQVGKGRTFTLKFSKPGYRTEWLGGTYPGTPTETNSRVATGLTSIDTVTLSTWSTSFGSVAGQNLGACTKRTFNPSDPDTARFDLGFAQPISVYGTKGNRLYVTDKGFAYLADSPIDASNFAAVPDLATWSGLPVFAPLWFDGDLSGPVPDSVTYGSDGKTACIRWSDVGHYLSDDSAPNTFQLLIISRSGETGRSAGDFDLRFNYDQVEWDASGLARVGYTAGDKKKAHYWVNPNATGPGMITDSGTSPLIAGSFGGSTPGRYVFEIHNALVNTAAPKISGSPVAGAKLSASAGSWSPAVSSTSYQWFLNGAAVSGATGSTWTVPSGTAVGSKITVQVTASAAELGPVSATSAAVTVVKPFTKQPTPKVSGTVKVGSTLTAKPGTWSPTASLRYQWYRGGAAISGATKSKYKVQLADVGQKLTVTVTGSKTGYLTAAKTSAATKTVPKVAMKAATPKVTGTTKVGRTLSVSRGSWTSGATFSYQWYRSGKAITGATGSSYLLTAADKGKTLKVKVTGVRTGYVTTSKTSKASKKIT